MKHPYNNDRREWAFIRIENIPTPFVRQVPNSGYQYKYNGKEYQDELGLNMYAMDMRQYDPTIARWVVQDPVVHHNFSPYNAFDNNPVFWADPSGADSETNEEWQARIERQWRDYDSGKSWSDVWGSGAIMNGGDKPKKRKEGPLTEEDSKIRPPFTIPSETETTVTVDNIDPLQLHREEAITLEEWVKKYGSWAQEKIALENGKDIFGLPNGPNKNYRYVINPYDNNVMDMRHVVVVGYAMGTINGLGAEIVQGLAGLVGRDPTNSAFNSQDKYSNSIGSYFFDYDFRQNGLGMSYNFGNRFNEFLKVVYRK